MSIKKERIKVYDMTCSSCEARVENAALKAEGVITAKASFSGQCLDIEYDDEVLKIQSLKESIQKAGYATEKSDYKFLGVLIIAAVIALLGFNAGGFDMESKIQNASYGVLFIAGILTSIHCVGMCGGIMLSQSLKAESNSKLDALKPSLLYNLGRVISYTVLGGIIGAAGSVFALSIKSKAAVQIIAGVFMIMMGFNMAGFGIFRKFQLKMPKSFCKIKSRSSSPFIVGIFNGLMPCGPLQTMQIFALGTSSMTKGALSMFFFSLGTVPLMLTFGGLSGLLSKGYTKRILKMSGVLVIVLGLIMGNRGLAILGVNPATALAFAKEDNLSEDTENPNVAKAEMVDGYQIIRMAASNKGFTPNAFYVQKGIPVKWIIDGAELNTCNNAVIVPSLNLEKKINKGENIIEFEPADKDMNFSCWMGMIGGVIKVVDDLGIVDTNKYDPTLPAPSTGPSCCARPLEDEGTQSTAGSSIYGNIKEAPTEMLINKAEGNEILLKGIGYELQPIIGVVQSGETITVQFDLEEFDFFQGNFSIIDGMTGEEKASFNGNRGLNQVQFKAEEDGIYGIVKEGTLLGIFKSVPDLDSADLEEIRSGLITD